MKYLKHLGLVGILALFAACSSNPGTAELPITEQEAQAAVQKLQASAGIAPSSSGALSELSEQQLSAAWANLSEREQKAAKLFLSASGEETDSSAVTSNNGGGLSAQAAGCWYQTWWRYSKNFFGKKLWQYNQRLNWCSNGRTITSASRERWGETYWIGWRFKGHIDSAIYGGSGYTSYRAVTQGHFEYGAGPWDIQHQYPRIDSTVYR